MHVFLMYREFVVDVTATQFGDYPDVMICKLTKTQDVARCSGNEAWTISNRMKSLEELSVWQKCWPPYQRPTAVWDAKFIKNPRAYNGT